MALTWPNDAGPSAAPMVTTGFSAQPGALPPFRTWTTPATVSIVAVRPGVRCSAEQAVVTITMVAASRRGELEKDMRACLGEGRQNIRPCSDSGNRRSDGSPGQPGVGAALEAATATARSTADKND